MRQSRIETFKEPPLPEIDEGGYLLDAFHNLNTGELITWSEINAYAQVCGGIAEPWEAQTVRAMSNEYLAGRRLGEDPFSYAPMDVHNE